MGWISTLKLTGVQSRVLFKIFVDIDHSNRITTGIEDIAKELVVSSNQVSKAFKVLEEKGIIYKDPDDANFYKLNPQIAHKGNVNECKENVIDLAHIKAIKQLEND